MDISSVVDISVSQISKASSQANALSKFQIINIENVAHLCIVAYIFCLIMGTEDFKVRAACSMFDLRCFATFGM